MYIDCFGLIIPHSRVDIFQNGIQKYNMWAVILLW